MAKINTIIKSKFNNEQHRFVTNLVYTANWVQNSFIEDLKPYNLSPQQYNILRILNIDRAWITMSDVKDGLLEKSPNTTRLIDKLLAKQLTERRASKNDRRVVYVRITKKGYELFEAINKRESLIQKALKNNISEKDAKYVNEILDQFRA